ncbi:hypothetical protein AKO1_003919 [Acrasis kona]|uniref:Uncharacterized protein n=1 Tax=Acrasis kona TaxID=1008807 RepID=A0AAW2ZM42_9EUKA
MQDNHTYTHSMAKLLDQMNRSTEVQTSNLDCFTRLEEPSLYNGYELAQDTFFSPIQTDCASIESLVNPLEIENLLLDDLVSSLLEGVPCEEAPPDHSGQESTEEPTLFGQVKSNKRSRSELDGDDCLDVKRVRFDKQFFDIMKEKKSVELKQQSNTNNSDPWNWDSAGAVITQNSDTLEDSKLITVNIPVQIRVPSQSSNVLISQQRCSYQSLNQMLNVDIWNEQKPLEEQTVSLGNSSASDDWTTPSSPSFKYLVKSRRVKKKGAPSQPQDAFQMSFKLSSN